VSPTDLRRVATVGFGRDTDRALCGDWDGNGTATPGVRRGQLFMLRNSWTSGPADLAFGFGTPTDRPVVGDWDGNGTDTPGVMRDGTWLLSNRLRSGAAELTFTYGRAGDRPIPGDWDGNGTDTAGVRRGATNYVTNGRTGGASIRFSIGLVTDAAVVGRWVTGGAGDSVSVWRRYPP
jgi:hypothetical protein